MLTSDRPYRQAISRQAARQELLDGAGSQFDPDVVAALTRIIGDPPETAIGVARSPAEAASLTPVWNPSRQAASRR